MTVEPAEQTEEPRHDENDRPKRKASATRVPPQDVSAEQSVLGAMLLSKDAIGDAVEKLSAGDFYQPRHSMIFTAIIELYDQSIAVDAVVLAPALTRSGLIGKIGGASYLADLIAAVPVVESVGWYADIVSDRAQKRRVIAAAARAAQWGWSDEVSGTDALDLAQQEIHQAGGHRAGDGFKVIGSLMQSTLDAIESAMAGAGQGIPTGFADLDRLLGGGLLGGQLAIVAARPGVGKSVFGLDVIRHAGIKHGHTAALFSLEMSEIEIMLRLLSAESRVPLNLLRSGQLNDDGWTKLARRMGEISEAPIFIDSDATTLPEIKAKARRLKEKNDLKLVVVDYLQLMKSVGRTKSREQEVSDLSRGLKLLAKEIDCPVIALSQLNRGPEQRQDKRPQLSELRESGSIEQDADIVMLLHRDDYYDKESPRAGEADIIVAKHRNGPTDTLTVASQLHLSRFVDMAI